MAYVKKEGKWYLVMEESVSIVGDYQVYRSTSKEQAEYAAERINKCLLTSKKSKTKKNNRGKYQ